METQKEKFNNTAVPTKETAISETEIPKMSVFDFCHLSGEEINRRMAAHFANREDVTVPESFVTIEKKAQEDL